MSAPPPSDPIEEANFFLNFGKEPSDEQNETLVERARQIASSTAKRAVALKLAGFPLFPAPEDFDTFPAHISSKARELFAFIELLLECHTDKQIFEQKALLQKLQMLIAEGVPEPIYRKKMYELDFSDKCNSIWLNEDVAYRCNTCALTPCMSLCAACFNDADHAGHDFARFFSREGGACDCGNADVIKESGFCQRHSPKAVRPPPPSPYITALAEHVVMRVIVKLLLYFRLNWTKYNDVSFHGSSEFETLTANDVTMNIKAADCIIREAADAIHLLQWCVNVGGPLRVMLSQLLLDRELYSRLTKRTLDDDLREPRASAMTSLDWRSSEFLAKAKQSTLDREAELREIFNLSDDFLESSCLLDELIFWCLRLDFAQSLINMLLGMLCDDTFRIYFAERFFKQYPLVVGSALKYGQKFAEVHSLMGNFIAGFTSRIIHVSVQLLSSRAVCEQLCERLDLIGTLIGAMRYFFKPLYQPSRMTLLPLFRNLSQENDAWKSASATWQTLKADDNEATIRSICFWFIIGDVNNLLSHDSIVSKLCSNVNLIEQHMQFVSYIQGLNVIHRIIRGNHVPFDIQDYASRLFMLELDTVSTTMFNLIFGLQRLKDGVAARNFFNVVMQKLENFFTAVDYPSFPLYSCPPLWVTFHIPFHRHLITLITELGELPEVQECVKQLQADKPFLKKLIIFPIRIQVVRVETTCNMWVRNGTQIRYPTTMYMIQNFVHSYFSPDMELIRFCAASLEPSWVWDAVLESFHVGDYLTFPGHQRQRIIGETSQPTQTQRNEHGDGAASDKTNPTKSHSPSHPEPMDCSSSQSTLAMDTEEPPECVSPQKLPHTQKTEADFKPLDEGVSEFAINWDGNTATILTDAAWIEPMITGALRLVAYLVLHRGAAQQSMRENIRDDIVLVLQAGANTHSKLRNLVIPDKGSHPLPGFDDIFEQELAKVAEFHEPSASEQGVFKLRPEAWREFFCPINLYIRSYVTRSIHSIIETFNKMEAFTRKEPLQPPRPLWTPFKLIDFTDAHKNDTVNGVCRLLESPRLFGIARLIFTEVDNPTSHITQSSLELAVYLLSLSAKFAASLPDGPRKQKLLDSFSATADNPAYSGYSVHELVFSAIEKHGGAAVRNKIITALEEPPKDRIYGHDIDYLIRLLALLYWTDPRIKAHYDNALKTKEAAPNATTAAGRSPEIDAAREERRAASKRRKDQIFKMQQEKAMKAMKSLMEAESISEKDLEGLKANEQSVSMHFCPFCGDTSTSSTERPLCIMVLQAENDIVGCQIGVDEPSLTLLEAEKMYGARGLQPEIGNLRTWQRANNEFYSLFSERPGGFIDSDLSLPYSSELRTCGHIAHIKCLAEYRASLINPANLRTQRIEMLCPICRSPVNYEVPLRIESGLAPSFKSLRDESSFEIHRAFRDMTVLPSGNALLPVCPMTHSEVWNADNYVMPTIYTYIRTNAERTVLQNRVGLSIQRLRKYRALLAEHLSAGTVMHCSDADKYELEKYIRMLLIPGEGGDLEPLLSGADAAHCHSGACDCIGDEYAEFIAQGKMTKAPSPSPEDGFPVLFCQQASLLTMALCFVASHPEYSQKDKKKIARRICLALTDVVGLRSIMQALFRLTFEEFQVASKKDSHSLFTTIAKLLPECKPFFYNVIFAEISTDPVSYESSRADFLAFAAQLCFDLGLLTPPSETFLPGRVAHLELEELFEFKRSSTSEEFYTRVETVQKWMQLAMPKLILHPSLTAKAFTRSPITFRPARLLSLPYAFDNLFTRFFNRPCVSCSSVPAQPLICLVCSQLVCSGQCCEVTRKDSSRAIKEACLHASDCHGITPFFWLNASLVVFLNPKTSLMYIWGTVYLDSHGEEDRYLRRGKPLFLSEQRWKAFEEDWFLQLFEGRQWISYPDYLALIRENFSFERI